MAGRHSDNQACIYGLYDNLGNLRYIGKANDPHKRLAGHMREARRRKSPLYDWIAKNGRPVMKIIQAESADWRKDERKHIAEARARGERLLNLADGGDEPLCDKATRASNGRKVADSVHNDPFQRRIWEIKRQLGQALKNGWLSEEGKQKMRYAASKRPDLFGAWLDLP